MLFGGCFFLLALLGLAKSAPSVQEYMALRNQTIQSEASLLLGGSSVLDAREELVNEILMEFKAKEYAEGLDSNGEWFASTKHIFHSKPLIDGSNIFKIIRLMPKGASLHMHDVTVAPTDFFVGNLSTWANLYYCIGDNDHLLFRFFPIQPSVGCSAASSWKSVASLREQASSPAWIDEWFTKSMNMWTDTPNVDYPNTNVAWNYFEKKITTISGMANYEPALREYYYNTLKYHHEDNVMYIEMRGLLSDVYHLNQSVLSNLDTLRVYKETTDRFLADYPDFFGAKFIFAPHRFHSASDIGRMIDEAVTMEDTFPDYFAGFDLVGQEDKGTPLLGFLPQLLDAVDKGVKFFFHAGETAWRGTKIDENVIDAILLNTTRIGHGYALYSHPFLFEQAKQKGIGIEVCPISNQILGLITDFRNHPGYNLMRESFPVVVSADGPGIYGQSALSHDYYIAFMAMGGERADLRFLKQLALNSIEYSAMSSVEKVAARNMWNAKWSIFLDEVLTRYGTMLNDAPEDNYISP